MIATSSDGLGWTDRSQPGAVRLDGIAHAPLNGGFWVATGSEWNGGGFDVSCFTSPDAASWAPCNLSAGRLDQPAFVAGVMVVPTDAGYQTTSDGTSWTPHDGYLPAFVFGTETLLVGSDGDRIYSGTSLDDLTQTATAERGTRSFTFGWVR